MFAAVLGLLLSPGVCPASVPDDPIPLSLDAARAEARRLSEELLRLAQREAWTGVERTYLALCDTGVEPAFADHLAAAHAASAQGRVLAVRERLLAATRLGEERDVIEWLFTIDTTYGEVSILDAGGRGLGVDAMPFDPSKAAAVRHARDRLDTVGTFTGLLPAGRYSLGATAFEVHPGRVVTLDLEPERARRRASRGL